MAKHLSVILKQYNDVISGKVPASKVMALSTGKDPGVDYAGKMPDERDFVASHSVEKFPDRNGNGDDVFNASNIKLADVDRHGHLPNPKSTKVYQQTNEEFDLVEAVKSGNLAYGYHGTITGSKLEKDKKYSAMHTKVKRLVGEAGHLQDAKKPNVMVKHFLDSSHGRHIAGDDSNQNIISRFSKFKKTYNPELHEETGQIDEAKDEGEYGYEGDMAITQLKTIVRHSQHLIDMLKPDTDLPEWVQAKITKAEDYISTSHDYLMSEMTEENGNFEQIDEADLMHVKVGEKVRLTNPKAPARHTVTAIKGKNAHVKKDSGEEIVLPLDRLKRVKYKAMQLANEEVEQIDEAKCNMTEAGTMCEVHGMKSCNKEETNSASDKEPRYNGKDKKNVRQLLTDKKTLQEKAESIVQQKLMAMALAHKRGEMDDASEQVKKLAASMTEKQLRDYAETKHTGLPKRVQKEESAPAPTPITFPVTNSREGFKL